MNDTIKIKTGLKGQTYLDVLQGVMGQLSDGIWENSRSYTINHVWRECDIVEEDNEIAIEVPNHFYVLFNCTVNDTQAVKTWFAKKVKAVVKEYIKDHSNENCEWSRDCKSQVRYFHGNWEKRIWPSIADAYNAYDTLLGRK